MDDFQEFLEDTYSPLLALLRDAGLDPVLMKREGPGLYAIVVRGPNGRVELTDAGLPVPPDPADITMWHAYGPHGTVMLDPDSSFETVTSLVVDLIG